MCCDLEDAVGGGVDDERTCLLVLLSVVVDDRRAGVWLVAENLPPECGLELCDHIGGKAVGVGRHRLVFDDARHLPMPDGRILAARELAQTCVCADGGGIRRAGLYAVDVVEPEACQIRSGEEPALCHRAERAARCGITELRRIGGRAAAEAVEHNEKDAFDSAVLHNVPFFIFTIQVRRVCAHGIRDRGCRV